MNLEAKHNTPPEPRQRERAAAAAPRTVDPNRGQILLVPPTMADPIRDGESVAAAGLFGKKNWLFAIALVAAVFVVYLPCWHGGYLFDDDLHLLSNPVLKPGGLAKIWVPGGYLNYWPLTFTV